MPCYHPLRGFKIGVWPETGKDKLKVTPFKVHHIEKHKGVWQNCYSDFVSPYAERVVMKSQVLPCQNCIYCRLKYARQWADRCMLELGYHDESWFVTLTYDEDHVPVSENNIPDPETGELLTNSQLTLRKEHLQLFMKRLRYYYEESGATNKLRFFACGEYGGKTHRPHYHLIIYGLHLPRDDLTPVRNVNSQYILYSSDFIKKAWPFGFNAVGAVTWDTCCYTARYILKKQKGLGADVYDFLGIEPEFTLMSRMPGIAAQYYIDHKDEIYEYDKIWMKLETKGYSCKPPRIFDRYFDIEEPEKMQKIKESRKALAEAQVRDVIERTKKSYEEYLADCERDHSSRIKGLQRRLQ